MSAIYATINCICSRMTDYSEIVLRWDMDNASSRPVFNEGGFRWSAMARRTDDGCTAFELRCDVNRNGPEKCEAVINTWILHKDNGFIPVSTEAFIFDKNNCVILLKSKMAWNLLSNTQWYNLNGKVTIEFRIRIISTGRFNFKWKSLASRFTVPNSMSNVILKIGDKKLHANKEILATHSRVFEAMFFGDFAKYGSDEVDIMDVIYEEFVDLLYLIYYPGAFELTDSTVRYILKLSYCFQMKGMIEKAENYLIRATGFDDKLVIADKYGLEKLRDHCLESSTSSPELVQKCESSPRAVLDYSSGLNAAVAPPRRRGRLSADEQLASANGLPVSAAEIADMSLPELQQLLKADSLTEPQRQLIRKIRRRGLNKAAARTCRQRRGVALAKHMGYGATLGSLLTHEMSTGLGPTVAAAHSPLSSLLQQPLLMANGVGKPGSSAAAVAAGTACSTDDSDDDAPPCLSPQYARAAECEDEFSSGVGGGDHGGASSSDEDGGASSDASAAPVLAPSNVTRSISLDHTALATAAAAAAYDPFNTPPKMADDSNIVVLWEVDKASARLVTGRMESGVCDAGGFKWCAIARRKADGFAAFELRCGVNHDIPWMCEVEVEIVLPFRENVLTKAFIFDENYCVTELNSKMTWELFSNRLWFHLIMNDKVTIEFRIRIINTSRGEPIAGLPRFTEVIADWPGFTESLVDPPQSMVPIAYPPRSMVPVTYPPQSMVPIAYPPESMVPIAYSPRSMVPVTYPPQSMVPIAYPPRFTVPNAGCEIVHQWEIGEAWAAFAPGRVESEVFDAGGFKWSAIAYRQADGFSAFELRCGVNHNEPWMCEVEINTWLLHRGGGFIPVLTKAFIFDENDDVAQLKSNMAWKHLSSRQWYNLNGKITIEFRIHIINTSRREPIAYPPRYTVPNADSELVLRWEIDEAWAAFAPGRVESEVFDAGGLKWSAIARRTHDGFVAFELRCDMNHSNPWMCEVEINTWILNRGGVFIPVLTKAFIFDKNNDVAQLKSEMSWKLLSNRTWYILNGKATIEFRIHIINTSRGESNADLPRCTELIADWPGITESFVDPPQSSAPIVDPPQSAVPIADPPRFTESIVDPPQSMVPIAYQPQSMVPIAYPPQSMIPIAYPLRSMVPMAGSELVLRWVIDEAWAAFATGRVESEVFDAGGFKWSAIARRRADGFTAFDLRCGVDRNEPWMCEVEINTWILGGLFIPVLTKAFIFDEIDDVAQLRSNMAWKHLSSRRLFNLKGKVTIEFRIHIISTSRGEPITEHEPPRFTEPIAEPPRFTVPNEQSDVILKIEGENLHVSKEILAFHSPVFEAIFFGDFAERGNGEVEINDVNYEEFVDLLYLIYPGDCELTDSAVLHILKLADRFQMKMMIEKCEHYLVRATGFDDKLLIADQYGLAELRDHCLQSYTSSEELIQKFQSLEGELSTSTKCVIFERLTQI